MEENLKTVTFELEGSSPLLMHNGQLSDPLNDYAKAMKEIHGKRAKTEADYLELQKREFMGSLYWKQGVGPVIPSQMLEGVVREGAKSFKLGKAVSSGVFADQDAFQLEYEGPREFDALFADKEFVDIQSVKVNTNRVQRCRPIFKKWKMKGELSVATDVIDTESVCQALEKAGKLKGMGDYRPKYGRFKVTSFEVN